MTVVIEFLIVALALYLCASIWAPGIRPYWRAGVLDIRSRLGTLSSVGAAVFFGTPAVIILSGPPATGRGLLYVCAMILGLALTVAGYCIDKKVADKA
ncbi:MAG TPA: hypothetical protein VF240_10630 [Pyrinomonadaceae bacterium]